MTRYTLRYHTEYLRTKVGVIAAGTRPRLALTLSLSVSASSNMLLSLLYLPGQIISLNLKKAPCLLQIAILYMHATADILFPFAEHGPSGPPSRWSRRYITTRSEAGIRRLPT